MSGPMRRFIAGAICPDCRSVDRIVVETTDAGRQRRCVQCGFAEPQADQQAPEPATRFTSRASDATPVQQVRLVDPARIPPAALDDGLRKKP